MSIEIVITTRCAQTDQFNRCRGSILRTIPRGVVVQVLVDRERLTEPQLINRVFRAQRSDFIYMPDRMVAANAGWYEAMRHYTEKFIDAAIIGPNIVDEHDHPTGNYFVAPTDTNVPLRGCFVRVDAVKRVGAIDAGLVYWDFMYFIRLRQFAYRVIQVPIKMVRQDDGR